MYNQKYHSFERFYNHKYGFHINGPNQAAYNAAERLKPRILKTLEHNVDVMKRLREVIPDAFFIGRLYDPVQDFGNYPGSDPIAERIRRARQRGRDFAEKILRLEINNVHSQGRPVFNAWESFNEIFPESVDAEAQKVYDEFQVAFGERMRAAGFEPVAFNFATGNFRGRHLVENFAGTLDTYKYLGFHEYDWPHLDRLHQIGLAADDSEKNLRDRLPGIAAGRGNDGMWLTLRYRRMMNEGVRQKYGDKHVCIITECGMTQGVQQGEDVGPWFQSNTLPRNYPDSAVTSPIAVEDYWQQLLWYNSELMKDDYLMGACLFVTGAGARWESFEHLGPIMDRLALFQAEVDLAAGDTPAIEIPAPPALFEPANEPLTIASVRPDLAFEIEPETEIPSEPVVLAEQPSLEEELPTPPTAWTFNLATGPGLPLLVGDIGLAGEPILVTRPNGGQERLTSGAKPEFGPGGFELYAHEAGLYRLQFLDQSFELNLSGRFTRITFTRSDG